VSAVVVVVVVVAEEVEDSAGLAEGQAWALR